MTEKLLGVQEKKNKFKCFTLINLWILIMFILWIDFGFINGPIDVSYNVRDCHVGCCPVKLPFKSERSPEVIELSSSHQQTIVQNHNKFRNQLAVGEVPGLRPAVRMATIEWNDDLANMAKLSSQRLSFHCDKFGGTAQFPGIGQNVAFKKGVNENFLNPNDNIIKSLIDLWFSEYEKANQRLMNVYNIKLSKNINNLSNMMYQMATKTGCGLTAYFGANEKLMYIFVCNYDFRPYPGEPVYTSGPTCSKCRTGCNPTFKGLCNESEYYSI